MKKISRLVLVIILVVAAYAVYEHFHPSYQNESSNSFARDDSALSNAFENHLRNIQVHDVGIVTRILPDDNEGIRHQRFILCMGSGQSILIAYNIDLAPRIENLAKGDSVEFSGEYEWDPKGGVVHWTHKDPEGRHKSGWIKHNGEIYQ